MTGTIPLIQLGIGGVGRELVRQVLAQRTSLQERYGIQLAYHALVDSSGALHTGTALDDAVLQDALEAKGRGRALASLGSGRKLDDWRALLSSTATPAIIIDVTAGDGLEFAFAEAVRAGHRVALANKRPLCGDLDAFRTMVAHGATRYEATVGAGLPVISTLQALLDSGDTVTRIEASLSGTLGFLCSALEEGQPLSKALHTARDRGWTEPDPRDDLGGLDVARKALILARTCGHDWALADIPPQPWYPHELAHIDVSAFMERVHNIDENYRLQLLQTRAHNAVLRYTAMIEDNGARVGFRELPADHPLSSLRGADNLIAFTTTRYSERPLVVRGPGAGIEVTAAGVLGDIVAHARELGASPRL